MRIFAGRLKDFPIFRPKIKDLRVTPASVRQEIFRVIGARVQRSEVLDLFAGSGSLGLEALSRGSQRVVFVDLSETSCRAIDKNLRSQNLTGRGRIEQKSAERFVDSSPDNVFDLVFFTPPYNNLNLFLITRIKRIIKSGGWLVVEHPPSLSSSDLNALDDAYRTEASLNFGWSRVSFLEKSG